MPRSRRRQRRRREPGPRRPGPPGRSTPAHRTETPSALTTSRSSDPTGHGRHGTHDGRCNRAALAVCGRSARADAPPYRVGNGGGSGISRQTENLFGHDVALDLGRAAADGQRRGEQEAAGPGGVAPGVPTGPVPASMPWGPARSRARSMMCWPWASAMALRTEASAPGARPARTAETIRRRRTRRIWASIQTSTRRSRVEASGAPPAPLPAPPAPDQIHEILGRRAHPPQRPLARERHTLVARA